MNKLLLIKGRDYRGHGVFAKAGTPLEVDEAKADELLATGYFRLVSSSAKLSELQDGSNEMISTSNAEDDGEREQSSNAEDETNNNHLSVAYIEGLKKEELIALAKEHNIDLSDCTKNSERVNKITGALGLVDFSKLGIED